MVVLSRLGEQAPSSRTRKRRIASPSLSGGELPSSSSKKRRIVHPDFSLPRLYENISRRFLEKNALAAHTSLINESLKNSPSNRHCVNSASIPPGLPYFGRTRSSARQLSDIAERVATKGPPDLTDLRGCRALPTPRCPMSSQSSLGRRKRSSKSRSPEKVSRSPSKSHGTTTSTSTRSTGPYDRSFLQHLIDHKCLPPNYEYDDGRTPPEPKNLKKIERSLEGQDNSSVSVSSEDFKQFKRRDAHATRESSVVSTVIPILEGDVADPRCICPDIAFTNLRHLTDGSLVAAKPDRCFGSRPESLERQIRELFSNDICPFTQEDLPILTNCFLEVKGQDGSAAVVERQLLYDMTLGERGYLRLLSYGSPHPIYDGNAHTLGFSYLSGQLKAYTCHALPPDDSGDRPTFVMTHINSWSVSGNNEQFSKGATAYRNGIKWAKTMREQAIRQANVKIDSVGPNLIPQDEVSSDASCDGTVITSQDTVVKSRRSISKAYESETSADELSLDQPPPKRKSRSPTKRA